MGGVLRSDGAVLRATTFWEFPIRTLYREFPETRASLTPKPPPTRGRQGPGVRQRASGARRQRARSQALVVVRDRPRMRGGGDRHVPQGLDRPLLFDLVDRLDRLHHAGSKPLGEKGIQII